jgi:hypothetical protein
MERKMKKYLYALVGALVLWNLIAWPIAGCATIKAWSNVDK